MGTVLSASTLKPQDFRFLQPCDIANLAHDVAHNPEAAVPKIMDCLVEFLHSWRGCAWVDPEPFCYLRCDLEHTGIEGHVCLEAFITRIDRLHPIVRELFLNGRLSYARMHELRQAA